MSERRTKLRNSHEDLDTVFVPAHETGPPPFGGDVVPRDQWRAHAQDLAETQSLINSAKGKQFYDKVNNELAKIAQH